MVGHQSAAVTLDVYANLFDQSLDDVADRLGRAAENAGVLDVFGPQLSIVAAATDAA